MVLTVRKLSTCTDRSHCYQSPLARLHNRMSVILEHISGFWSRSCLMLSFAPFSWKTCNRLSSNCYVPAPKASYQKGISESPQWDLTHGITQWLQYSLVYNRGRPSGCWNFRIRNYRKYPWEVLDIRRDNAPHWCSLRTACGSWRSFATKKTSPTNYF